VIDEQYRPPRGHTGLQRAVVAFNSLVVVAALATAGVLKWGADTANSVSRADGGSDEQFAAELAAEPFFAGITPTTVATFDALEAFDGENWLVTGSDSRKCITPNATEELNHSDTMMLFRLDTTARQAVILSLPRDLWVTVTKGGRKDRINTTYDPQRPKRLADTIRSNLGIGIDHYLSIDFCAFRDLVDELDGIQLYFDTPVLDRNTGLNRGAGCEKLTGAEALAYVRSRHFEQKIKGKWVKEQASDLARIARQQSLVKRLMSKAIAVGPSDPVTAARLIRDLTRNVTLDNSLSNKRLVDLALQLRSIDPATIQTFQLDVVGKMIDDKSVVVQTDNKRNRRLLSVFQGKANLAAATDVDGPSTSADPGTSAPTTTAAPSEPNDSTPEVVISQESKGFVPREVPDCPA
jgi:LCP family protein required for cell wall assembly